MEQTILLVDDDEDYIFQMRTQLEKMGFHVMTAGSVAEANAACAKRWPNLAILDLMLEHVDAGFAFCYQLKKKDAALPVILVTAIRGQTGMDFDAATEEERSWIKADVMLDKPVRFETLQLHINRLLDSKETMHL